jgi:glycosyltransferase involved in cell wall biosynthesis
MQNERRGAQPMRRSKGDADMHAKADLHVHSKHSNRPSDWFLRRVGAPECYVEPLELYRRARAAGMDFVTISDHNTIAGALEIAHLPGTFLSCEVTTYFPEDGCKIHLLVCGMNEEQFRAVDELRHDIYELRRYATGEGLVHSVAHPFFRVDNRLTPWHVERLLLLFDRFEGLNGARDERASRLVNVVFRHLTPQLMDELAARHALEPIGDESWRKRFTGGSDDHSGLYVASAYTSTPPASTVDEFLKHLRCGRHEQGGRAGSSRRLAHSFYQIAYEYYRDRFGRASKYGPDLLGQLLENLLTGREPVRRGVGQRMRGVLGQALSSRRRSSDAEREILVEISSLLGRNEPAGLASDSDDARTYRLAAHTVHLLGYRFCQKLCQHLREGRILDALQSTAALGPVALGVAPYLVSFATQHKDEAFLQEIARRFPWARGQQFKSGRKCWVTDTYSDINGVARTIQTLSAEAARLDLELEVLSCQPHVEASPGVRNFAPVGLFALPEYELQQLAFPPFLDLLAYVEERQFREVIVSTPGPLGLAGLVAGKLLGLRLTGIYHTDFPAYVRHLTGADGLEALTRQYVSWFYDQMDVVYAPSESYRRELAAMGFAEDKLRVLRRGVDVGRFGPERRTPAFWERFGRSTESMKLLYVGRLSHEKNLELLLEQHRRLVDAGLDLELVLVGDGPARDQLEARYRSTGVLFTGFLEGEALATAFASADLFVFPSTTDTFGNVVLEAQASGLPAIVSHLGGPREIIQPDVTGVVVDVSRGDALGEAIAALHRDRARVARMSEAAARYARTFTWDRVLSHLWAGEDGGREESDGEVLAEQLLPTSSMSLANSA